MANTENMEKEFKTLSDCVWNEKGYTQPVISVRNIKEFLKRIEAITDHSPDWEKIKKLAGDKLKKS